MFGPHNPDVPNEISFTIFGFLPKKEILRAQSVSSEWKNSLRECVWQHSGATSYEEFSDRIKVLPKKLQKLIINDIYDLKFVEKINELSELNFKKRASIMYKALFEELPWNSPDWNSIQLLLSDNALQAQLEKLFKDSDVQSLLSPFPFRDSSTWHTETSYILWCLSKEKYRCFYQTLEKNDIFLDLLREKIITFPQMNAMHELSFGVLKNKDVLKNLKKKLFTMDQLLAAPKCLYVYLGECLECLEDKLFTFNEIASIQDENVLRMVLSPKGILALKEKLISFDQIKQLSGEHLERLLVPKGLDALRNKTITPEQVIEIKNPEEVTVLINNASWRRCLIL